MTIKLKQVDNDWKVKTIWKWNEKLNDLKMIENFPNTSNHSMTKLSELFWKCYKSYLSTNDLKEF